jgi:hypothetical protein
VGQQFPLDAPAFLASAHIGATVGGNATGFSPLSPVAVPLWADPPIEAVAQLVSGKIVSPLSGVNRLRKWHSGPTWDPRTRCR